VPEVAFTARIKPSSGGNIPSLGIGYFFFPSDPNCFRYAVFDRYSEIPFGMTRLDLVCKRFLIVLFGALSSAFECGVGSRPGLLMTDDAVMPAPQLLRPNNIRRTRYSF
jgi:hypothetical protein